MNDEVPLNSLVLREPGIPIVSFTEKVPKFILTHYSFMQEVQSMRNFISILLIALCVVAMSGVAWGATITTTGSGNWSSTTADAPWPGGSVPLTTDNVIIADGHTVIIDQNVTVVDLTVGGGTSGTLIFNSVVHAVTVNGNITVATGGKFVTGLITTGDLTITSTTIANVASTVGILVGMSISGTGIPAATTVTAFDASTITLSAAATASGTGVTLTIGAAAATNTLSIAGNITNNGTFDMSQGGSTLICNVTFTKAGDQTISGTTPIITRFRSITLAKTLVGNKVLCSINASFGGASAITFTAGTWEQTANTLSVTSGSQTIGASGALVFSGSGSLNMVIAGSWTVTGSLTVNTSGSFSMGSGNNSITTSGTQTINFTSGTVNIYGRLTLTTGTTVISGANIFIDPQRTNNLGGTSNPFECSGTANLTFSSGSITLVDPIAAATTGRDLKIGGTTGTVDLSGGTFYFGDGVSTSTSSTVGGFQISNNTASPVPLGNVVLQTGGIAGRNVGLATSVNIGGTLTFTAGNLTLGTNTLTLGSSATVSGAAATKCIVTNGTGSVARSIAASGSFQFPIAPSATTYDPLTIALDGTGGETFNVRVESGLPFGPIDATLAVQRTWTITKGAGSVAATLTFQWLDTEAGAAFSNAIAPYAYRHNGSVYEVASTMDAPAPSGSYFISSTLSTVGTFSPFIVGTAGGLPIQLSSFTGTLINNRVKLDWATISEVNNYGFYVEKRPVGVLEWRSIDGSFVAGHGTTNVPQHYTFTDNGAFNSATQYRLKQVDLDGSIHFTDPIQVESPTAVPEVAPKVFALLQNYPNPFNPSTEIKFSVETYGHTSLRVYDMLGREVATLFDDVAETGYYYKVKFDASNFASGMYFYRLESGKRHELKKLLLLK